MIEIRSVMPEDLKIIDELNELQDFKLKGYQKSIIDKMAWDESGSPVAYGITKRMAEVIMLVNPRCSTLKRAEAMRELMKYAEMGAKRERCEQLHAFVKNEKLARTLEKKFGFIRADDIVLVKNL